MALTKTNWVKYITRFKFCQLSKHFGKTLKTPVFWVNAKNTSILGKRQEQQHF